MPAFNELSLRTIPHYRHIPAETDLSLVFDKVYPDIRKLAAFYYRKFTISDEFEDVLQDIVTNMLNSHYLERFDESRSLHKYLSGFIYNYFCKAYHRGQSPIRRAVSLFSPKRVSSDDDEDVELIDTISDTKDPSDLADSELFMEQMFHFLNARYGFTTFVAYDCNLNYMGAFNKVEYDTWNNDPNYITFVRSAACVFRMLSMGFNQVEITDILKVSKSWVSKIVSRISSVDEIKSLAKEKGFSIS